MIKRVLSKEQAAKLVADWNAQHPSGTPVDLTDDNGVVHRRATRSEAWVLPSGVPVVMVEGLIGAYLLTRLKPAEGA